MRRTSSRSHSNSLHRSLSVIIPVFNGGRAFQVCLKSLAQYAPAAVEVVVVVDGHDPASVAAATDFGATVIQLPRNYGPAHARNVGAAAARGELLFFVDADVAIHPETIGAIAAVFDQPEDDGLVALIGSYDDAPGSINFLSQYRNLLHHYTHQQGRIEASTFWGACGVIRRDVFLAVGGFNVAYRYPCIEDIELGYRLRRYGHRIALCKHIQVKHLKRWTVRSLLKADFFYRAIPWTELLWRDRTFVNDLNLDASSRLSVVSVYGLMLSLGLVLVWQPMSLVAVFCAATLLVLNSAVYQFFHQKRGLRFAAQTVAWHWLYYAYSGLAFVLGTASYWLNRHRIPPVDPPLAATPPLARSRLVATAAKR
ncbi:glycosyltransferase family 2 protein [filamentous cyanobacterium LEGE 11480]|uniref:Glycosyltransferase family 2 protein n=1 Tax=Romeriopsis navalis LEGE 11480 TaxID=2777977 RepID=A0A928VQK2_9CYAN|nr:glycosyltransferase [Romeriopsis navalis]MBE9030712.1 glycosyltransferase family 2 protein [Romeriopsis navalis LEGE 11480]